MAEDESARLLRSLDWFDGLVQECHIKAQDTSRSAEYRARMAAKEGTYQRQRDGVMAELQAFRVGTREERDG